MFDKGKKMSKVISSIYNDGTCTNILNLKPKLRTWAKIFLDCFLLRKAGISSDIVNTDQKFMFYFLDKWIKINHPPILLKHLRDVIKGTRNSSSSI